MNGSQVFIALFAILVTVISLWSVIAVVRSRRLTFKPLWVIGCLIGFVGFGIDWTTPDDIIVLFGISVPVVMVFKVVATGQIFVKTGFPIISVVALIKAGDAVRTNGN